MFAIIGDADKISSERYFVTITCFTASIFLVFASVLHLIMDLNVISVYLVFISTLVITGLYFVVRFTTLIFIPKLVLTGFGLIMLDFTWYSKYLSNGPVLFFILIFGALILWVWEGKWLAFWLVFYFINLAVLFIIDYNAPDSLFRYPDQKTRSIDIYSSLLLYSSLMILLLYLVKREFIRQKENAIKSDKLKSAFLANMSHEIRTPLNAIIGFSELLGDGTKPDKKQQYINIIRNSSNNLLRLINDIIDLSKIEAGDMELKYCNFSILELFTELKDYYDIEIINKNKPGIVINFSLPHGDINIYSDPLRLKQVLSNLINNAVKFTSRGLIKYSCEQKVKDLIFSVSDTGTGIPEEDQQRIFERFTKFDYKGLNTDGSGIGLSIVERIVSLLGGQIWLKSIYGEGSVFFFSIPNKAGYFANQNGKSQKINNPSTKKPSNKILVVEDDEISFLLISEILKPFKIKVHLVADGADAIKFLKKEPEIRLILMDMKLPHMDGFEATQAIKKLNPQIPIIALTGYAMAGDKEKALSAGCDDYLIKPLDSKKLKTLIGNYLAMW